MHGKATKPKVEPTKHHVKKRKDKNRETPPGQELIRPLERAKQNQSTRRGITVYGNIAPAAHGETHREVLGSGDDTQASQEFTLPHPFLAHLSANNPAGSASTLQVFVDDVPWGEVESLARAGPKDHVFSTRTSDDGKTTVIFGDGRHGARVPSGSENVVATYQTRSRRGSAFTRRPPDAIELAALDDGLMPGRWLIVGGDRTDIPSTTVPGGELVMLARVEQKLPPQQRGSVRQARDNAQINAGSTHARRRPRRAAD
jgi:hypothetical protein